jgi:lysine 6-dehydrogenase
MGYAMVYDLIRSPRVDQVVIADKDKDRLDYVKRHLPNDKVIPVEVDVTNEEEVVELMRRCDLTISCVNSEHNYELAKLALNVGTHFCDLGCDEATICKEFRLDEVARQQGITIIPNLGLAPTLVSILSVAAANLIDELYEIRIRFGNVPAEPEEPLNFVLTTASDGLINDYVEQAAIIRDGQVFLVPALTDREEIDFPRPFGKMEAFHVAGNLSNLQKLYAGKLQHLDYKAVHYPGHCQQMSAMKGIGLMNYEPVHIGDTVVRPRELLAMLFEKNLPRDQPDVVLIRIAVTGIKRDKPTQVLWECVDYSNEAEGLTAMMRMTAFPASAIAQMLARGDIKDKGVLAPENVVPAKLFLAEMAGRGITLTMTEREPAFPGKGRHV